jgi:type IV secretion system protein VirB11
VVVNRPGEIGVECNGAWSWHEEPWLTFDRLDALSILAARMTSKECDADHPLVDTNLPGRLRLAIARPPATHPNIISLTIRRPPAHSRSVDDDDFVGMFENTNTGPSRTKQFDAELLDLFRTRSWRPFFRLAVQAKKTIGAVGMTGSGKTDMLRRLMRLIPEHERLITLEDTDEFGKTNHRNRVSLFYGSPAVTSDAGARAILRMRPDRPILQELRGAETFSFVRIAAAGHPGGLTTWHAGDTEGGASRHMTADEAFDPLVLMFKQHEAGATVPDDKVRQLLRRYIDVIVWCDRSANEFNVSKVWFKLAEDAGEAGVA